MNKMYLILCLLIPSLIFGQAESVSEKSLCNSNNVDKYLDNLQLRSLNIETKKPRKWAKNYLKIILSKKNNIEPKYKKKFSATIKATFTNDLICSFNARIRVNGDWKDHVYDAPASIASLDVKLLNGNIDSVVKFKLLLPHTRNGDNEVFVSTLLGNLGFISPKTYYLPTTFNGIEYTYLFQEKEQKELLESHQLREGPILEGDERFTWLDIDAYSLDHRFGIARLVNKNWANKGSVSLSISQEAMSLLNTAYLDFMSRSFSLNDAMKGKPKNGWYLDSEIIANGSDFANKKNKEYVALLIAMQATHALRPHNRKYYYDPIYKHLLPIYYDGNSNILDLKSEPLNKDFLPNGILGAQIALASISKIDKKQLQNQLVTKGVNITLVKINQVVKVIEKNIRKILAMDLHIKRKYSKSYFSIYDDSDKLLVFTNNSSLEIMVCNLSLTDCNFERLNIPDYSLMLSGRYKNSEGKHYLYIGNDKKSYQSGDIFKQDSLMQKKQLDNNVSIMTYGAIDVDIDEKNKTLYLTQTNKFGRAIIVGGFFKNWNINFKGVELLQTESTQRFDENLITGCLTLLDIDLENVNITVNNSICEDAVNLIRATGNINSISVYNAYSDALDVDFSSLDFSRIDINGAGNDCIDFSSGTYAIINSTLSNCKDKAISVGEGAIAKLENVDIIGANVGIAAKDSSSVAVNHGTFKNVSTCLSASRKKQEYWGSILKIEKHNCNLISNYQQIGSLIEFEQ